MIEGFCIQDLHSPRIGARGQRSRPFDPIYFSLIQSINHSIIRSRLQYLIDANGRDADSQIHELLFRNRKSKLSVLWGEDVVVLFGPIRQ